MPSGVRRQTPLLSPPRKRGSRAPSLAPGPPLSRGNQKGEEARNGRWTPCPAGKSGGGCWRLGIGGPSRNRENNLTQGQSREVFIVSGCRSAGTPAPDNRSQCPTAFAKAA